MIGCTSMERLIVAASLKSPLELLAGSPSAPQFIDIPANFTGEIDPRCQFLYINVTDADWEMSAEVWAAILHQEHEYAHAILYRLDFKVNPGQIDYKDYQELALYTLRTIEKGSPTYASFRASEENGHSWMVTSTYSLRPIVMEE